MTITTKANHLLPRIRRRLFGERAAIDLASIMVGVLVIGIVGSAVGATITAVIPWSQDQAARAEVSAAQTAEGTARIKDGSYLDGAELADRGWLPSSERLSITTDVAGICYNVIATSASGNRFWGDNTTAGVHPYAAGVSESTCAITADAAEPMVSTWAVDGPTAPRILATDGLGNTYVADGPWVGKEVRGLVIWKVDAAGNSTRLAGIYDDDREPGVPTAEEGPGNSVYFWVIGDIAADDDGNVFVTTGDPVEGINQIKKVDPLGNVSVVAGTASRGYMDGTTDVARFDGLDGIDADASGNLYVTELGWSDETGGQSRVRKIGADGAVTTVAGGQGEGYTDGSVATAQFAFAWGNHDVAVDPSGDLLIADGGNSAVRRISAEAVVSTVAGSGSPGHVDGPTVGSELSNPTSIDLDGAGNIYVLEPWNSSDGGWGNNVIRRISANGQVSTLAGTGELGHRDGPAHAAQFEYLISLAVTSDGRVLATSGGAEHDSQVIRVVE